MANRRVTELRETITGILEEVSFVASTGKYKFLLSRPNGNLGTVEFIIGNDKAMKVMNGDGCVPKGVPIKVSGKIKSKEGVHTALSYVKIHAVDGVELTAWSQRVGSPQVSPEIAAEAAELARKAEEAEKAMVNRAPPEQPGAITDPLEAYDNAMRIVRRQRRLKNPQLSQQEIWQVRDALNLLAEKLGIA